MLLALTCLPAIAEQRTANDAQNVAMDYLLSNAPRRLLGVNRETPQLTLALAAENAADHKVDYYVFNDNGNRGFVIVSGDDNAAPVLGYCDEGSIDPDNMPDGLRYMLECYAEQMRYLRLHPESAYVPRRAGMTLSISPLLKTSWNQDAPYNNLCPTYAPDNAHAATGCAATAVAQVMNYHQWPKQGTGEYSYVCNVNNNGEQTLSADFGATTYDWDNMLNHYEGNYTEAQGNAVATLMNHVGIAAHMDYGATSNTTTFAAMEGLRSYFKYNKSMKLYTRTHIITEQWDSLLMNELINARPVVYAGFTPNGGGHGFVLDGCNADGYYHINWGWGGSSNGYFLITALNPDDQGIGSFEGGYNASQEFIANLYPDKGEPFPEGYLEGTCYKIWPEVSEVNLGQKVPINIRYLIFNGYGYGYTARISYGFMLSDTNGNQVSFTTDNILTRSFELGMRYSYYDDKAFQYTTPERLADGDYYLWLVYKEASQENYSFLANAPNLPRYLNVRVENGVMTLWVPDTQPGKLSVTTLTAPQRVGTNNDVEVSATIANAGGEYYDNVYLSLYKDGTQTEIFEGISINVSTGGNVLIKTSIKAPEEPGEYELALLDKDLNRLSGESAPMTVVVSNDYNLSITTQLHVYNYYMEMDSVGGTAVITNSGTGDYVGPIPYMILSSDGEYVKAHGNSPIVTIPVGGSATVRINTNFEGIPGVVYKMCLRDFSQPDRYVIWGEQVPFQVFSPSPTIFLDKLLVGGVVDGEYRLANNLTIIDSHEHSLFATDGSGSWIEVKCGDFFDKVKDLKAFKAGTVYGKYALENGNPSLTLTRLPDNGTAQPVTAEKIDLSKTYSIAPDMVIDVTGYYNVIDGKHWICEHNATNSDYGQGMPIAFDWLSSFEPLTQGKCYDLHGVVRLNPATSGTNFSVYLTKAPVAAGSSVGEVNSDAVKISVTGDAITVEGAQRVAVYNVAGMQVGSGNQVRVPAGIYIVIADGLMRKVVVR